MANFFDSANLMITCPSCGKKHSKTVRWLKANKQLLCGCGADINLDKEGFTGSLKKAEQSLADFRRKLFDATR